jgi:hypothetical protein
MALNIIRLTANVQQAFINGGAVPGPALTALSLGIANAIITELNDAIVTPAGIPPMTTAPTGGPVLGTGKIT